VHKVFCASLQNGVSFLSVPPKCRDLKKSLVHSTPVSNEQSGVGVCVCMCLDTKKCGFSLYIRILMESSLCDGTLSHTSHHTYTYHFVFSKKNIKK